MQILKFENYFPKCNSVAIKILYLNSKNYDMKNLYGFLLLSFVCITMNSCDKDDPMVIVPQEIITTLTYTLTAQNGDVVELQFSDIDGDGGVSPTLTGGTLTQGTTYAGSMDLLNESVDPAESITEEIEEEDDEHQFFFQTDIAGLTVAYNDLDDDNNPLGLNTTLTTGDAGVGTLTVILRHQPDKDGTGVSDGNIANAGGETDIEVTFDISVE
jgi:hypothetical protein